MRGKFKKDYWIIKLSGLFDPAYYLKQYPDVRQADVDPLEHFVMHGWKEGRNPNEWFDTKYYLESNPDVAQAGINPFVHWIRWGRREGRKASKNIVDRELSSVPILWEHTKNFANIECPICKNKENKPLILKVKNPFTYSEFLNLYKCNTCDAYFFSPFKYPDYSEDYGYTEYYWKFYLQQGAGIDFMIKPIIMVDSAISFNSFLDVGCGFGFTVDFCENILRCEKTIGVEPGQYGIVGSKLLGIKIINDYLENIESLKGEKFDVVFSSEVIEHVLDPYEFVCLLKRYINENGVLVLTTPNAEFIRKDIQYSTLLEILFPGFHSILFTPSSISYLLRKAGFFDIQIIKEGHRIIAFASLDKRLNISSIDRKRLVENYYIPYLKFLLEKVNDDIRKGSAWRLFKEYVNMGKYQEAVDIYDKYLRNPEIENVSSTLEKIKGCDSLECIGKFAPYFIGGLYYYIGMCYLNYFADYKKSSLYFAASFDISLKLLKIATAYYEEVADLLWRAKFHEGLSYLYMGNKNNAEKIFRFILENIAPRQEYFYIKPPDDILLRVREILDEKT